MKRSAALAPLSRDHHHALEAARRLRATPADAHEAVARFLTFWTADGRRHFAIEEEHLLPALPAGDREWDAAVQRVLVDHADIRTAAGALAAAAGAYDLDAVRALGERLHEHVRFEERHLFTLLEDRLAPADLEALGQRLLTAPASGGADLDR